LGGRDKFSPLRGEIKRGALPNNLFRKKRKKL
jgi:hypothetical protein